MKKITIKSKIVSLVAIIGGIVIFSLLFYEDFTPQPLRQETRPQDELLQKKEKIDKIIKEKRLSLKEAKYFQQLEE